MHRMLLAALVLFAALVSVPPALAQDGGGGGQAAIPTININPASPEQFEALPGIGAKTAARIVEYRQKNGPFKKVEELMNVNGIGEKSFLKLKPYLTVAGRGERAGGAQL